MRVRVRFRFNTETGEVEVFRVDDLGGGPGGPEHDAEHDRVSAELGSVTARRPEVEEVTDPTTVTWSLPQPADELSQAADTVADRNQDEDPDTDPAQRDTW